MSLSLARTAQIFAATTVAALSATLLTASGVADAAPAPKPATAAAVHRGPMAQSQDVVELSVEKISHHATAFDKYPSARAGQRLVDKALREVGNDDLAAFYVPVDHRDNFCVDALPTSSRGTRLWWFDSELSMLFRSSNKRAESLGGSCSAAIQASQ